jgi:ATP synthase protein I
MKNKNFAEEYKKNFMKKIEEKEELKLKGEKEKKSGSSGNIRILGTVGWSVVVPLILGTALGSWIDKTFPTKYSFTLMLMIGGLFLGCWNAWYRVKKYIDKK